MSASGPAGARRRWVPWALFVAFVVVPLLEIWVVIQVGSVIGAWWTILLLVLDSLVGAWLVRHEGARTWRALQEALRAGSVPGRELADGALVLIGGTLMLTPGFMTDVLGAALVLPLTRPVFRRLLAQVITRRLVVAGTGTGPFVRPPGHPERPGNDPGEAGRGEAGRPRGDGDVVAGEVVDDPDGDPGTPHRPSDP